MGKAWKFTGEITLFVLLKKNIEIWSYEVSYFMIIRYPKVVEFEFSFFVPIFLFFG